jgi:hypothetical protein
MEKLLDVLVYPKPHTLGRQGMRRRTTGTCRQKTGMAVERRETLAARTVAWSWTGRDEAIGDVTCSQARSGSRWMAS